MVGNHGFKGQSCWMFTSVPSHQMMAIESTYMLPCRWTEVPSSISTPRSDVLRALDSSLLATQAVDIAAKDIEPLAQSP